MRKMSRGTIEADKRDTVAEVLKDIVVGKTISKERAHAALAYHNKVCESIKDTKEVNFRFLRLLFLLKTYLLFIQYDLPLFDILNMTESF